MSTTKYKVKYGSYWAEDATDVEIEIAAIRLGGQWENKQGKKCGLGLFEHFKNLQMLLFPSEKWHRWKELVLRNLTENNVIGIMGAASSGKTHEVALYAVCYWLCFPNETTILCSSTTREMLEMRIWGEIKKYWSMAKERYPFLAGTLIESRQRIVYEPNEESGKDEKRDFRNGICGVPCKKGGEYVGLGDYVGVKNKRLILIADELQFMPRTFLDTISNLNKNPIFKCIGVVNPKDRTDALGYFCEPEDGWDSIDYSDKKTKIWKTRFNNGVCINLIGYDSPNFDYPEDEEPKFPFLINRRTMENDIKFYGEESLQFQMMDVGILPRETGARRVLTRLLCEKFNAFEKVVWDNNLITKMVGIDAAYGNIGGDRCVLVEGAFGESNGEEVFSCENLVLIPVKNSREIMPEEQICLFVKRYCEERNIPPSHVFFDSTGRGSLMSAFARLWSPEIVPVEFGGKATERRYRDSKKKCNEIYRNMVTELWFSVRATIESGQFRGMTEELLQEAMMREWILLDNNVIQVEPKDKTKQRMGKSPDLFDALVVCVEGARRLGFKIKNLDMILMFGGRDNNSIEFRTVKHIFKKKQLSYA